MPRRRDWKSALPLLLLALSGCGGGPSNRELCLAIVAALPVVYGIALGVLWLLEQIRRAPDRGTLPVWREALATTGGLALVSAIVMAIGARPKWGTFVITLVAFGAVALFVSLVIWLARRKASYASRILRAAQIGSALGLPALVLWPDRLDAVAGTYITGLAYASLLFAIYATPLLLVGLLIEALVRRKRGENPTTK